jgi:hypothetical protein
MTGYCQEYGLAQGEKFQKVHFNLINNLIIIPVEVNGTPLSFVLDSGVSTPILFNISNKDSIQLNNVSEISINGLGGGEPISALSSSHNYFKLGKLRNFHQDLYVVLDAGINLSPSLGVPVHGIIGYDLFKDFVVSVNYQNSTIKFYRPEDYHERLRKRDQKLAVSIIGKRAYMDAEVVLEDLKKIKVKMLLDTGSSDAVWLFENEQIKVPKEYYHDFLGQGLVGDIYGKRTKINSVIIGDFVLKNAKTAFPDMDTFNSIKDLGNRNGSLGGEVLKRFNITFNYPKGEIVLQRNGNFKAPFHFNFSGIDLQHAGVRLVSERIDSPNGIVYNEERNYGNVQLLLQGATRLSVVPEIVVSGIRAGSPAQEAGLREGDIILAVNGKKIHRYKLQEVLQMLNEQRGRRVKVLVERYKNDILFSFMLKDLFK